ncbi:VWA domain-containing protein [Streptomyces sp. DG2A-72]|uniref:VWA domain-containing protein n=1 Tax=Streptomyces sp. DG2A-72 TaxID=3051386 RepID=UPI00265B8DD1|nr:VWA domain-containing protein [Streptomyces sp. DG2A-72]MDO0934748.1 VWA domain-containing protein [Streptomyces sp. DG2A-72]
MGILTLLRNAFGRSRKARTAEAEGATPSQTPEPTVPSPSPEPTPTPPPTASIPEPRPSTSDDSEHDLVSAAFDNVTVPRPAEPMGETAVDEAGDEASVVEEPVTETPVAEEPVIETPAAEEAVVEQPPVVEEPVADEPVAEEPVAVADEPTVEPVAEPEPTEEAVAEEPAAEEKAPEPTVDEPVAEEPEPVAAAVDEPLAADGEDAPQGPPAADDESSTGGAGGNDAAEGEAEAEPEPQPQPEAVVPTTLQTAYTAAATTLTHHNLTTTQAKIYLVLDRSASMRPYYKDGSAQALGDQTLALAAHLDPDATVHVTFFSTEVDGTGDLTLPDHTTKIDDLHASLGRMGRTSYHAAVEEITTHYTKSGTTLPALVIFQTDGAPDAKTPATQSLTEAAKTHPALFFSFVAFGEHDNKAFDYLRKLKTENTAFFHAGPTPKELTDTEFYEGVLANWRP